MRRPRWWWTRPRTWPAPGAYGPAPDGYFADARERAELELAHQPHGLFPSLRRKHYR